LFLANFQFADKLEVAEIAKHHPWINGLR